MATVPATPPNNAHHGGTSTFYLGMIYNKRLTNFTTQLAVLKQRTLIVDTIIRAIFAALISVVLLSACISHPDEPDITNFSRHRRPRITLDPVKLRKRPKASADDYIEGKSLARS